MATQLVQFESLYGGDVKFAWSYDDVTMLALLLRWDNRTSHAFTIDLFLTEADLASDIAPGTVTSLPLAAGALCPFPVSAMAAALQDDVVEELFTPSAAVAVGATSIPVVSKTTTHYLSAGQSVMAHLPTVRVPAAGNTQVQDAFWNKTCSAVDNVDLSGGTLPIQTGPAFPGELRVAQFS